MDKNKQLIAYLVKSNPRLSVTSLMKLSYLVDLVAIKNDIDKISDFNYIRYKYGPFDNTINWSINSLVQDNVIIPRQEYSSSGNEYIIYEFNNESDYKFDFSDKVKKIIDEVVDDLRGYGAKTLTDIAYKTKPMIKLGATLGGDENLNKALDLKAK